MEHCQALLEEQMSREKAFYESSEFKYLRTICQHGARRFLRPSQHNRSCGPARFIRCGSGMNLFMRSAHAISHLMEALGTSSDNLRKKVWDFSQDNKYVLDDDEIQVFEHVLLVTADKSFGKHNRYGKCIISISIIMLTMVIIIARVGKFRQVSGDGKKSWDTGYRQLG
eukprot:6978846-Karenia_brevis.AAC.1